MNYSSKTILAPMVRVGTFPTRRLAVTFGADIVYTEEIIDFKMLKSTRIENEMLGTVDFVMEDGTVVFRTRADETDKVVFQIGTCDSKRALKVAKMVEQDVAGFDVNMGCPKTFSISGGMGAALLKQPEKIKDILITLVSNLKIPVTCKIRCLNTVEETVKLALVIQSTGVAALAIHGRTRDERPSHTCRLEFIREVAKALTIPVIANGGSGDIKCYDDIESFRRACGTSSVMVARAAEWNVSIFRKEGMLDKGELIKQYIKLAIDIDNHWTNTKYCIQHILGSDVQSETGVKLLASRCPEDIYVLFGMMEYYTKVSQKHKEYLQKKKEEFEHGLDLVNGLRVKVIKDVSGRVISYESHHRFDRKFTSGNATPKMFLIQHLRKLNEALPTFEMEQNPVYKQFRCTLVCGGIQYICNQWHKRKVWAEHAACEVYMQINGIVNTDAVSRNGQTSLSTEPHQTDFMKIDVNGQVLTIKCVKDVENCEVQVYEADLPVVCDEATKVSPMESLYKHLLKKGEAEPEYDYVCDKSDGIKCTLRHNNVEYTCDAWFSTRREAVNSACAIYMLINKIPIKSVRLNSPDRINHSEGASMKRVANFEGSECKQQKT